MVVDGPDLETHKTWQLGSAGLMPFLEQLILKIFCCYELYDIYGLFKKDIRYQLLKIVPTHNILIEVKLYIQAPEN